MGPNDDLQWESRVFDEEASLRHELEQAGRVAAEVMIDLQDKGPLYAYVLSQHDRAMGALRTLIDVDPNDAVTIAQAQGIIQAWTDVCRHIRATLDVAEHAANQITEIYGDGNTQ